MIRTEFGRFTRQVSGYSLEHLLPENGADLARFLAGTEGTLGMITGATVALVPSPKAVALAVLGYPDMPEAADAVPGLLPHRPVAMEGMDSRLVDVFRARRGDAAVPALPRGQSWLFVETAGDTEAEARAAAARLIADAGCLDSLVVTGAPARALWRIREDGAGLGSRTPADAPAWPGWEDAAVPPRQLGAYLRDFAALMAEHGLDGLIYGHFGDGCVHIRIDFPFSSAPGRYRRFVEAAAQLVGKYGGSMSGEHGDGRARGELLPAMYSAEAIERHGRGQGDLRPGQRAQPRRPRRPGAAGRGPARAAGPAAAPRARLRLLPRRRRPVRRGAPLRRGGQVPGRHHRQRGRDVPVVPGHPGREGLHPRPRPGAAGAGQRRAGARTSRSAELAESLDLCLSCKGCSSDCPAGVDMATYKAEVLYQRYRRRPRPPAHYSLGWLPRWARLASRAPGLANAALRAPGLAGLAKRLGGIDARRPLPRFAAQTFRAWFAAPARPRAAARHAGAAVGGHVHRLLHPRGRPGRRAGARGRRVRGADHGRAGVLRADLDLHRPARRRPPAAAAQPAAPWARRSTPASPSSASSRRAPRCCAARSPSCCRTTRAPRQVRPPPARWPSCWPARPDWEPPDLGGVRAVAQPHCHHHAVMGWHADAALLARAGAEVTAVGGCCGLAGNFGVERGHYDVSAAVAETALLPAVRAAGRRGRPGRRVLLPHPARPARPGQRHPPGPAAGQPPGATAC